MFLSTGIILVWLNTITTGNHLFTPSTTHRVQYHLPDNSPENHLVGNIIGSASLGQPLVRAMLNKDTWFRITSTGDLFTRDKLDRDVICSRLDCCQSDFCQLNLEAYLFDTRPTPITVQITLFIADENDNAPVFPKSGSNSSWWPVSIPESAAVGTRHTLPAATDADSSRFGVQSYKLFNAEPRRGSISMGQQQNRLEESLPFSLVTPAVTYPIPAALPAPQLQIDRPLDRESKASYYLYLVAEDAGAPPLTTSLSVRINILDTNDNPPTFINQTTSTINIPENTAIGTTIHQFFVKDQDEGPNGNVSLSIDWPASYPGLNQTTLNKLSSKYSIHPYTGELRVVQPLDYENELERKAVLIIRAVDNGSPQQTASSSLTISLIDVNDNGPVIEVLGVDMNSEANSEPLVFQENESEPKLLRLISVTDPDSVSAGKLSCKLSDQHQSKRDFLLTSYSATMYGLLNARAFDYEREASRTGHLSVSVECTDAAEPKRTRQQWIQIPLADVNDNWPQFSQANYEFHVAENTEPGIEVGLIKATDADSGVFGSVTYRLTSDTADWLDLIRIDPKTGTVYVNALLDREEVDRLEFHVTAMDGGPNSTDRGSKQFSQKTNTTGLTIIVGDVNDNTPMCMGPKKIHVEENIPVGTRVLFKIAVSDPDLDTNGTVVVSLIDMPYMYSMNLINHDAHSSLDVHEKRYSIPFVVKDDLSLVTAGLLDREQQSQITLSFLVKDKGVPIALSTTCSLTVIIDDVNDNSPQLVYPKNTSFLFGQRERSEMLSPYNRATVPANIPFGTRLITIRGKDLDAGPNGTVTYHLIPLNTVNPQSFHIEFSEYGEVTPLLEESMSVIQDGMYLFNLDASNGYLTTAWGDNGETGTEPTEIATSINLTSHQIRQKSIKQPDVGLYAVTVELRDAGTPPLTTRTLFYVNISEPVGTGFAFGLFSETNLSNTIILVLIMVCSLALIISLTAAIFWVRFRNDHSIGSRQDNRAFLTGYNGGNTMGNHETVPNGYFYPTNYPPLGSPTDFSELEQGFSDTSLLHCSKDATLQTNWNDVNLEMTHLPEYQSNMYGGSMLSPVPTFQLRAMNETDEPMNGKYSSGIHLVPVSMDRGDLTIFQQSRTPNGTANWLPSAEPYITDQTMVIRMDGGYGPAESITLGQATNNSTGGSDSGVDSGAGVVLGTITSASPILETRGRTSCMSTAVGKPEYLLDQTRSSIDPQAVLSHHSPFPVMTGDSSEATLHEPMPSPKESFFLAGSTASRIIPVVHYPTSVSHRPWRGEEEYHSDAQTAQRGNTTARPKYSAYSGTAISTYPQANGLT